MKSKSLVPISIWEGDGSCLCPYCERLLTIDSSRMERMWKARIAASVATATPTVFRKGMEGKVRAVKERGGRGRGKLFGQ